jgi:anthranilate synthase/aminodeoxychorismate synthase-like glutamine amidotransferase
LTARRILIVDNYDSFTYNLVQLVGELGAEPVVFRAPQIRPSAALRLRPAGMIVSPGPKGPSDTEAANRLIRALDGRFPILGVCLGHQCIAHVYGARIVGAARLVHGMASPILHDGSGIFRGLPNPFPATRYHSLVVEEASLPSALKAIAHTLAGELMGIRVRGRPTWGVQFHPESILTADGRKMMANFLLLSGCHSAAARGIVPEQA